MKKIAASGSDSESGFIIQRHVSADPDPPQNVMDPQHCLPLFHSFFIFAISKFSKAEKNIRKKKTSETLSSKQYCFSAKNWLKNSSLKPLSSPSVVLVLDSFLIRIYFAPWFRILFGWVRQIRIWILFRNSVSKPQFLSLECTVKLKKKQNNLDGSHFQMTKNGCFIWRPE
jgi:hypothetical protein